MIYCTGVGRFSTGGVPVINQYAGGILTVRMHMHTGGNTCQLSHTRHTHSRNIHLRCIRFPLWFQASPSSLENREDIYPFCCIYGLIFDVYCGSTSASTSGLMTWFNLNVGSVRLRENVTASRIRARCVEALRVSRGAKVLIVLLSAHVLWNCQRHRG